MVRKTVIAVASDSELQEEKQEQKQIRALRKRFKMAYFYLCATFNFYKIYKGGVLCLGKIMTNKLTKFIKVYYESR